MILETHNGLADPHRIACTRAVVRDRFNQVIVIMIEPEPGQVWLTKRGDVGFEKSLKALGIQDTVIRTQVIDHSNAKLIPETGLVLPD